MGSTSNECNVFVEASLDFSVVATAAKANVDTVKFIFELLEVDGVDWVNFLDNVPVDVLLTRGYGVRALVDPPVLPLQ